MQVSKNCAAPFALIFVFGAAAAVELLCIHLCCLLLGCVILLMKWQIFHLCHLILFVAVVFIALLNDFWPFVSIYMSFVVLLVNFRLVRLYRGRPFYSL